MKGWDRFFCRQREVTKDRPCAAAPEAMGTLELSPSGIAHMGRLSDRLEKLAGRRIAPVSERVADDIRHR
jgi:phenylalanine-4-hydroxylase